MLILSTFISLLLVSSVKTDWSLLRPNELSDVEDPFSQIYQASYEDSWRPIEVENEAEQPISYLDAYGIDNLADLISKIELKGNPERGALRGHEDRISPPVNDPNDFESAIRRHIDGSEATNDKLSIDNIVSSYVNSLTNNKFHQADLVDKFERSQDEFSSIGTPSISSSDQEYIDSPLALSGHQYVQGGAGEGKQLLGPDGTFENVQVVKSDSAVPSYCDPPNPCPIGYTAKDGCLEGFVNSASFSREYQARQECSCDNEHSLFNCVSPISTTSDSNDPNSQAEENELSHNDQTSLTSLIPMIRTLARTIKNRFGGLESISNLIRQHEQETQTESHN